MAERDLKAYVVYHNDAHKVSITLFTFSASTFVLMMRELTSFRGSEALLVLALLP